MIGNGIAQKATSKAWTDFSRFVAISMHAYKYLGLFERYFNEQNKKKNQEVFR
jgi:hypothetical protein